MDLATLNWTDIAVLVGTFITSIGGASVAGRRASEDGCASFDQRIVKVEQDVADRDHKTRDVFNEKLGYQSNELIALKTKMDRSELDIRTQKTEFFLEIRRLEAIIDIGFRDLNKKFDYHFQKDDGK